jgi:protein-tyrosine phosphatase
MKPIKVLMVCYGNICRSPMAEAIFQHMVNEAHLTERFMIDSAGTSDEHEGELAHIGTRTVLQKHSIPYNGRSRPLQAKDLLEFDLVLGMDNENMRGIERLKPQTASTRLFLADAYQLGLVSKATVDDPYFTGLYDDTYDLLTIGAKALLERLRREHSL